MVSPATGRITKRRTTWRPTLRAPLSSPGTPALRIPPRSRLPKSNWRVPSGTLKVGVGQSSPRPSGQLKRGQRNFSAVVSPGGLTFTVATRHNTKENCLAFPDMQLYFLFFPSLLWVRGWLLLKTELCVPVVHSSVFCFV